jgi:hypothetical protein
VAAFNLVSQLLQWQLEDELPAGCPPLITQPLKKAKETRWADDLRWHPQSSSALVAQLVEPAN